MEYLFELIFEGSIGVSKNKKTPQYIRNPLIAIIIIFLVVIGGVILLAGILSLKENIILGVSIILLGILMFIMSIIKFREIYLTKKQSHKMN